MRKSLLILYSIIYILYFAPKAQAIYDPLSVPNNKVGVHILSTDEVGNAAKLVNASGGDWGYVTVPIQPGDRDKIKWQAFMHECRNLHIIPIIRITTIPLGGTWIEGRDTDLVDFANFLTELDWPASNHYIVLFNEVNQSEEWGGIVDPGAYARIVKNASSIFKSRSPDFFILGPALDSALPNSDTSMSAATYLKAMENADPGVWEYFDGWASHSYPNPGFAASPSKTGWTSIVSYRTETATLSVAAKPVFITETGWDITAVPPARLESYWRQAWSIWNNDPVVVAVTPFVLSGGDQFRALSLIDTSGNKSASYLALENLAKTKGEPRVGQTEVLESNSPTLATVSGQAQIHQTPDFLLKIENFFRKLFNLLPRGYIQVVGNTIEIEVAGDKNTWSQGLSGRESLAENHGLFFVFPVKHVPQFWMKDMNFAIDMIWIDGKEIIDITASAPVPEPGSSLPTFSPSGQVDKVLEVPAGYAESHNIQIGDSVSYIY